MQLMNVLQAKDYVKVILNSDSVTVEDNGRGIQ